MSPTIASTEVSVATPTTKTPVKTQTKVEDSSQCDGTTVDTPSQQYEEEPIQQLFQALTDALRKDPKSDKVRELLADYISNHDDWKEYALYSDRWYSRNLINRNEVLELILLCWEPDQKTFCHNHPSNCWLSVVDGEMNELQYVYENTHSTEGSGRLQNTKTTHLVSPDVGFIDDGIAFHVLANAGPKRAATLHLYSPPVTQCNLYDIETGNITVRKMCYYTVNKQRV